MLPTLTVLTFILASIVLVSGDVVFTRREAPEGWTIMRRAAPNSAINFIVALKQQHLDVLESKFWSVSDPKSPEYQNFMSIEEIRKIIAPKAEDVTIVTEWLLLHGVRSNQIQSLGDALEITTSVAVAEKLFETQFYLYTHKEWKKTVVRQFGSYSLPPAIRSRVDLVSGLAHFPPPFNGRHELHTKPVDSPNAADAVAPQTVYGLYSIGTQTPGNATSITSQGVIEFEDQTFSKTDLSKFSKASGIPITPLTSDHIIGPEKEAGEVEASLDLQYISSVNIEATNWFWIEADPNWLYAFATHFFNTTDVPLVISISYGWWEGDQCNAQIGGPDCKEAGVGSDSDAFVARVNTLFQQIGLRGVTIVVSSGDSGAHSRTDPTCTAKTLRAEFPAASPYVTSVGATQITNGKSLANPPTLCSGYNCLSSGTEVAVSFAVAGFTSGGGFSEVAAQPSYQTTAVKNYLSSGVALPPASMYNASNRAHPDVAAVGNAILVQDADYGGIIPVGGTSASSPIVAAILSLLNQASIAKTSKPLGFVNPLLYQIYADQPTAFTDVTVGDNKCTEDGCAASCKGYEAAKGWDPVTGLGTPNYAALLQYIQTH